MDPLQDNRVYNTTRGFYQKRFKGKSRIPQQSRSFKIRTSMVNGQIIQIPSQTASFRVALNSKMFDKLCRHAQEVFTSRPMICSYYFYKASFQPSYQFLVEPWVFDRLGPYSCEKFICRVNLEGLFQR
jgi:hypothetical protein